MGRMPCHSFAALLHQPSLHFFQLLHFSRILAALPTAAAARLPLLFWAHLLCALLQPRLFWAMELYLRLGLAALLFQWTSNSNGRLPPSLLGWARRIPCTLSRVLQTMVALLPGIFLRLLHFLAGHAGGSGEAAAIFNLPSRWTKSTGWRLKNDGREEMRQIELAKQRFEMPKRPLNARFV